MMITHISIHAAVRAGKKHKTKQFDTKASTVVPDQSTSLAQPCLTSACRWERVCSRCYDWIMSSVYGHSEYKVFVSVSAFEITYRKRIRIQTSQILRNAQQKRIRASRFFHSTDTDTLQIPCLRTRTRTRVRVRVEPYGVAGIKKAYGRVTWCKGAGKLLRTTRGGFTLTWYMR